MKLRLLSLLLVPALLLIACSNDDDSTPNTPNYSITISGVVPISGPAGAIITIKGSNFGTNVSEMHIQFGSVSVTAISLTDTEMKFKVPAELPKGATTIDLQRVTGKKMSIQFTVEDPIVGIWTSEGATNIAPRFYDAPFNIRKITASFKADGSYLVVQTDSNNTSHTVTGIYVAMTGTAPAPNDKIRLITVTQGTPTALIEEGIYEVTVGDSEISMQYEVVRTEPPVAGVSKPTAEAGFGSSMPGQVNVQRFVKK